MSTSGSFESVLYFLGSAAIIVPLFRRLGLGAILGYLCAGVLIGPGVLSLIDDPQSVLHFAEIGVIMLLFLIGLELNPGKLWKMKSDIMLLGGGQIILSILFVGLITMLLLSQNWTTALVVAMALALSSTAFAIQLMSEKGIIASPSGRQGFSMLLMQDLAVIPILFVVTALSATTQTESEGHWYISVLAIVGMLLFGRFLLNPLLKAVAIYGSRDSMTATALLIVVGSAYLMEMVHLSMGLGAFLAGIMLANSSFRHQLETDVEPFKGLTLGLFFIAVGMTLDLDLLITQPVLIIGLTLLLCFGKMLIIALMVRLRKTCWKEGFQLGLMLSQGGEFGFVIMTQALSASIVSTEVAAMVTLIIGFSMALTPLLTIAFDAIAKPRQKPGAEPGTIESDQEPEVLILGFGRFGQITGRILNANRIPFIALDKDPAHIDFVKQYGNTVHYGDAERLDLLQMAGIEHVRTVVVAIDEPEVAEHVVHIIRSSYPDIHVIARARNRPNFQSLKLAGAQVVIREVFDSSLAAAEETLRAIGYTTSQAIRKVNLFQEHDERMLDRTLEHQGDTEKLIEISLEGRKELEDLFVQDQSGS